MRLRSRPPIKLTKQRPQAAARVQLCSLARCRLQIGSEFLYQGQISQLCQKSDVESLGKDAAGNESKVLPAVEIKDCTADQCTARIDHGPDYEKSFVRIKCQNGAFSGWLEVKK
jgi:hypothetical protein